MNEMNSAQSKPQLRMYVPMAAYCGDEGISVTICLGKKQNQRKRELPDWMSPSGISDEDCPFELT